MPTVVKGRLKPAFLVGALAFLAFVGGAAAAERPPKISPQALAEIQADLERGISRDLVVSYETAAVLARAKALRSGRSLNHNDDAILGFKSLEYRRIKEAARQAAGIAAGEVLKPFENLPAEFVRVSSVRALQALLSHPGVQAVALPERFERTLTQSLPLIHQPQAQAQGAIGAGSAVAILDTGVDYTRAAFGSCAAPGPACAVVYAHDFAADDGSPDANGHGTNVAGIVHGVAPGAKIIALDVFTGSGAYTQDILAAIDWTIQNRSAFNIVAINMSLGGAQKYTQPVTSMGNAFKRAIDDARAAGILSAVASGNSEYTDGISLPAAVDTAVSVGAVYDSNFGTQFGCRSPDATAPDKVACFSNSASFLSVLAPGASINAAGITMSGTSQATPHVAGAIAVLRAAFPDETLNQIVARLANGVPVLDARNGITKPRIDVLQSLGLDLTPDAFVLVDQTGVAPNTLAISNPVTIAGINGQAALSISAPGEYSLNGGEWLSAPRTVAYGDVVRVRLTSSPGPSTTVSTTLTVGGLSDSFSVTTAAGAAIPSVQLSPGAAAFGNVAVGATGLQTLTLTNSGTGTLSGIVLSVSGQDFTLSSTSCGSSLAPLQNCTINVAFAPSDASSRAGSLDIVSDAPGSPHAVPLSGTGVVPVSLAQALDNPGLAVSTSGDAPWYAQSVVVSYGTQAAQSGAIGNSQASIMETVLSGPGTASFQWKVSSELNFDFLTLTVDGVEQARISGTVDWSTVSVPLAAGAHLLRWTYSKDSSVASGADAGWVDRLGFVAGTPGVSLSGTALQFGDVTVGASASQSVTLTNNGTAPLLVGSVGLAGADFAKTADACSSASVAPSATCSITIAFSPTSGGVKSALLTISSNAVGSPHSVTLAGNGVAGLSLGDGVDNNALSFTTGGNAQWFARLGVGVGGGDAAQSGVIADGQSSYLETTVTGPGLFKFWWKVSSEADADELSFAFDGVPQDTISGEVNWAQRSYHIGAGNHVLRWTYAKDNWNSSGQDAGWVDQVEFTALAAPANLAEALEAPGFAWQTYGDASWTGQSAVSFSGGSAARSGAIADNGATYLGTTIRGPGTLSFRWKVSSEDGFDGALFLVDGFGVPPVPAITGEVDWVQATYSVPPGDHLVEWAYAKDPVCCIEGADAVWVDKVTFTPTTLVPLGEALDNTGLAWSTTPSRPWQGQTVVSMFGGDAAESATIGDGETSELSTEVSGPGTLSFRWKVSSEEDWDFLRFYLDGAQVPGAPQISGELDWVARTVSIPAGTHSLKWAYEKDVECCVGGADKAWVDQVEFVSGVPAPVNYTLTVASTVGGGVSSAPAGIACGAAGASCSMDYTAGTVVVLNAAPLTGYQFSGWSGACGGSGTCALTMDAAKSVTATFAAQVFHVLTVRTLGSGSVSSVPAGIACGADCSEILPGGSVITLSAVPSAGYVFRGWGGACNGAGPCTLTIDAPTQVSAVFASATVAAVSPKISAGYQHMLALRNDGTLWSWGKNILGELGDGTTTTRLGPVQVGSATNWIALATGANHSLAVRADGTLWAWGSNSNSALGDGTSVSRTSPMQIGASTLWDSVAAGAGHSMAVRADGTLWGWGDSGSGQLGSGAGLLQATPAQVGTGTDWRAVSAGYAHSVGLRADGSLWAWGANDSGQLGDGTITNRPFPVQIGASTNWSAIAVRSYSTLALKSDGTLWGWGQNDFGQLGDGSTTNRLAPVQIGSATNWTALDQGVFHSLAVRSDGTLWSWGYNSDSQLGDSGYNFGRTAPARVGVESNWSLVTANGFFSAAMRSDGSVWGWGYNYEGEVGDGTDVPSRGTPTPVLGPGGVGTLNLLSGAPSFILSVSAANGTVTSNPAGIDCGGDCSESYAPATVVTLTAIPAAGYVFSGWAGACSGTGACNVTMDPAQSVTANFSVQSFLLSVTNGGNGAVASNPAGINCPSTCGAGYASGTPVTLTATPNAGFAFDGWTGECSGTGSCSVTMNAARNVGAAFSAAPVTLPLAISFNLVANSTAAALNVASVFGSQDPGAQLPNVTSRVDAVWSWNATTRMWRFFSPQLTVAQGAAYAASRNYEPLANVPPGEGYWISAYQAFTLAVPGGTPFIYAQANFGARPQFWNMLGNGATQSVQQFNCGVGASATPPCASNFESLWAWNPQQSKWYFHSPQLDQPGSVLTSCQYAASHNLLCFDGPPLKQLEPGSGFWVYRP